MGQCPEGPETTLKRTENRLKNIPKDVPKPYAFIYPRIHRKETEKRLGMKYGYARVSTAEQNLGRQIEALQAAGIEPANIYTDKVSGAAESRPALDELLEALEEGDSVTVLSFDRLARSTMHLLTLAEKFNAQGVNLISIKDACDTTTPQGKFFFTITAAFAEMERAIIKERQAEGIALAKKEGRMTGRPKVDQDALETALTLFKSGQHSVAQITKQTGIGRTTVYREAGKRGITRG